MNKTKSSCKRTKLHANSDLSMAELSAVPLSQLAMKSRGVLNCFSGKTVERQLGNTGSYNDARCKRWFLCGKSNLEKYAHNKGESVAAKKSESSSPKALLMLKYLSSVHLVLGVNDDTIVSF